MEINYSDIIRSEVSKNNFDKQLSDFITCTLIHIIVIGKSKSFESSLEFNRNLKKSIKSLRSMYRKHRPGDIMSMAIVFKREFNLCGYSWLRTYIDYIGQIN